MGYIYFLSLNIGAHIISWHYDIGFMQQGYRKQNIQQIQLPHAWPNYINVFLFTNNKPVNQGVWLLCIFYDKFSNSSNLIRTLLGAWLRVPYGKFLLCEYTYSQYHMHCGYLETCGSGPLHFLINRHYCICSVLLRVPYSSNTFRFVCYVIYNAQFCVAILAFKHATKTKKFKEYVRKMTGWVEVKRATECNPKHVRTSDVTWT